MPDEQTVKRARKARSEGKAPSTQAGDFVREEIHHVREGKHGARSSEQAIAIGLSKARRAGVELPPPEEGAAPEKTVSKSSENYATANRPPIASRRAKKKALKREPQKLHRSNCRRGVPIRCAQTHEGRALGLPQRRQPEHARSKNEFAMIASLELMLSALPLNKGSS